MAPEYPTILDLVGATPIVRLDAISRSVEPRIVAKLEHLNPGGSVKDRIGMALIEAAEREGKLLPGGTIVEPTSGNTGVGLAIAAAGKGYRCIFVMPDKMSQEKISMLRAYGAEVVICPTAVEHDSPESYYSVSDRLAEEIPGGFKLDQYSNMANPEAHYRVTGPEIWEQTGGEIDAIVISVGTGGTISGAGRFLKEQKPDLLVVGADPEGSVYTADDQHGIHPYLVEGIGKDTWPKTMDPRYVDEWIRVSDRDSFLTGRRLAREEGLLVGGSAGTTVCAALEIAHRFGREATILTRSPTAAARTCRRSSTTTGCSSTACRAAAPAPTVAELLRSKRLEEEGVPALVTIGAHQKVGEAIDAMQRYSISQLPVVRTATWPRSPMSSARSTTATCSSGSSATRMRCTRTWPRRCSRRSPRSRPADPGRGVPDTHGGGDAVVVARDGRPVGVLTRSDLLEFLAHRGDELPVPGAATGT